MIRLITVKILNSPELIEDACALLHEVYIEECLWKFKIDNPSQLRIEVKNERKLLKDRFTDYATWFGAFDEDRLIACGRLCSSLGENNEFEIESYEGSKVIKHYLLDRECLEVTRIAVSQDYRGQKILNRLYLFAFEYCKKNNFSFFGCANNPYVKSLLKMVKMPLKMENAFKYDELDDLPVNFYFASHKNDEIDNIIIKLKKTINNIKYTKYNNIFSILEKIASFVPAPLYWHDTQGVVLGVNQACLVGMGIPIDEIIGKTPYDFYPKDIAEHILTHNMQVMLSGETLSQEEYVEDVITGRVKYYKAIKSPLYNDENDVIGIIGTSIDITSEKEAQRLALENEAHKIENERHKPIVEEQEKFKKIVGQMVHDIQSPLASLRTIVESAINIPENDRITLRNAAMNITDITTHMLNKYKNNYDIQKEQRQPLLLSAELLKVLGEKRYEYKNLAIEFISDFHKNANFSFINIEPSSFKRMISNVINNSIDALENRNNGKVILRLNMTLEWAIVSIEDNGCGMSEELIDKITNNFIVTDKKNGHGLGLSQIHDTLENNYGKLLIKSTVGEGTKVILMFPKIPVPNWIAEEINIFEDDIVVIVDDETSIHGAWDVRFSAVLKEAPIITVKHFLKATEAVEFINYQDNNKVSLSGLFYEKEITYTKSEFKKHLENIKDLINL